jgi:hypothetical protein
VPSALRSVGEKVEIHDDHFSQTTVDVIWINKCGKKGWIALSRDTKIRARELERKAVESSGVYMFILVSKGLSGKEMAASFTKALGKIKAVIKKHRPPVIAKVYKDGSVTIWDDFRNSSKKRKTGSKKRQQQPKRRK